MRKNPHVRIRGGLGSVTALVYPTPITSVYIRDPDDNLVEISEYQ